MVSSLTNNKPDMVYNTSACFVLFFIFELVISLFRDVYSLYSRDFFFFNHNRKDTQHK